MLYINQVRYKAAMLECNTELSTAVDCRSGWRKGNAYGMYG